MTNVSSSFIPSSGGGGNNGSSGINPDAAVSAAPESSWELEFRAVCELLQGSPWSETEAVAAALQGLDAAAVKRRRDAKLHQKFAVSNGKSTAASAVAAVGATNTPMALSESVSLDMEEDEYDAVKVEYPRESRDIAQILANSNTTMIPTTTSTPSAVLGAYDDWHTVTTTDEGTDEISNNSNIEYSTKSNNINNNLTGNVDRTMIAGREWASTAIAAIATHQVVCPLPLHAIVVVLHATLLQNGWICTGVPEPSVAGGGFAAPVRDLPATQFLPHPWSSSPFSLLHVQLRYRHNKASGSRILGVTETPLENSRSSDTEMMIQVSFETSSPLMEHASEKETSQIWRFPTSDHVNLKSWEHVMNKSTSTTKSLPPALHYRALPTLLATFVQRFPEVVISNDSMNPSEQQRQQQEFIAAPSPYVDYTMIHQNHAILQHQQQQSRADRATQPRPACHPFSDRPRDFVPGPGINSFVPPHGDFSGDLVPTGLFPYPGGGSGGVMPGFAPGNLMGPNHPMFHPGNGGAPPLRDPMIPRFDPFGPPGGPTEPCNRFLDPDGFINHQHPPQPASRRPPGGTGNPNNDLLRTPPTLNGGHSDMYS